MSIKEQLASLPRGGTKQVAALAGVHRQTIWRYQTGQGHSVAVAKAIAAALGCPHRWTEFFDDPKAA